MISICLPLKTISAMLDIDGKLHCQCNLKKAKILQFLIDGHCIVFHSFYYYNIEISLFEQISLSSKY